MGIKLKFRILPPEEVPRISEEDRHPGDRYGMGYHWEGEVFGDRPLDEARDLVNDEGGHERKPIKLRPDGKSILSTNMLESDPSDPRRFRLRERFRRYFGGLGKRDVQSKIDRLRKEIAEMEGGGS